MNTTIKSVYILFLIILAGIFFRVYNVNFDDLWIDEIATFWISNPEYSINESFKNKEFQEIDELIYEFNSGGIKISNWIEFKNFANKIISSYSG